MYAMKHKLIELWELYSSWILFTKIDVYNNLHFHIFLIPPHKNIFDTFFYFEWGNYLDLLFPGALPLAMNILPFQGKA